MGSRMTKLVFLSFLTMCCNTLVGQTSTGTIVGQVKDGSGAVLANATVKLTLVAMAPLGTLRRTNQASSVRLLFRQANTRSQSRLKALVTRP